MTSTERFAEVLDSLWQEWCRLRELVRDEKTSLRVRWNHRSHWLKTTDLLMKGLVRADKMGLKRAEDYLAPDELIRELEAELQSGTPAERLGGTSLDDQGAET